tara:strand:- start:150 stop:521 length:372 start_codon:yes stop_codon:yes gene_type:complete
MVQKELIKEFNCLLSVIKLQKELYQLLIIYSNEFIPIPNDRVISREYTDKAYKFNISQMTKYISEFELINDKLMNNFNDPPPVYQREKDELDDLLEICHKDICLSNISLSDITDITDITDIQI